MSRTRRSFLKKSGAVVTAMTALSGCSGNSSQVTDGPNTTGGGSDSNGSGEKMFRLPSSGISTLDPVANTGVSSGIVIQQMFDALMSYPNGKIAVENQLAKSYSTSEDYKTYTFELKEGVTFHDGSEMTADDIIYSWERLANAEKSRRAYFILDSLGVVHETDGDGNYKPGTLALEAVDDYTLKVELSEPFHSSLEMFAYSAFAVVPEGLVDDLPNYDGEIPQSEFAQSNPIGAGPFQFVKWSSANEAEVERFENYHGEKAKVAGVHWDIIKDQNARYNHIMGKNVDFFPISIPQYDRQMASKQETDKLGREFGKYGPVRNGEKVNYISVATITSGALNFDMERVPKAVRKAAAYLLNQEEVARAMFKGRAEPGYHWTPPNIYPDGPEAYKEHAKNNYPYGYNESKPEEAKRVMEEAGYSDSNRFSMELTTFNSLPVFEDVGKLLRDQLASVYVDMTVTPAPPSALINKARKQNLDAWSWWWIMDWPAPDNFLQLMNPPQTDPDADAPISYINWTTGSDAQQQATEAYQTVLDSPEPTDSAQQQRNEAYVQMEEANWEDLGFLPIYHPKSQRFWYNWVDFPGYGGAGPSRMNFNTVEIGNRE